MIFIGILFLLGIAFNLYFKHIEEYIRKESIRNKVNTFSNVDFERESQIKLWYKKSFTKDFHKYIYDLSPFKRSLWVTSIIDKKSFDRYLSIDQFNVIVILSSLHLVMLDNKLSTGELKYINNFYKQFLEDEKRSDLIWLLGLYRKNSKNLKASLNSNLILESVIEGINVYFLEQHKYTLIYYLFELAECDNEINNNELNFIFRLARNIGLSKKDVNTITALYYNSYIPYPEAGFNKEEKNQKTNYRENKSYSKRKIGSKFENALAIFNLKENSTNQDIKKAYRKMVKIHHPDKVAHLGRGHVLKATELFKRINHSYEYLKKVKGF